jgi:hypothetical protein
MNVELPVRSYAIPKRGPTTSLGHVYDVSAMPLPAWRTPFVRLPVPGITVPIAAAVFAAPGAVRIWPVRGSTALRALPEQTVAPLLQPAMYNRGAFDSDH